MYVDHKRQTTGDFAIEEIVKYLQNCREEKHEVNWAGVRNDSDGKGGDGDLI